MISKKLMFKMVRPFVCAISPACREFYREDITADDINQIFNLDYVRRMEWNECGMGNPGTPPPRMRRVDVVEIDKWYPGCNYSRINRNGYVIGRLEHVINEDDTVFGMDDQMEMFTADLIQRCRRAQTELQRQIDTMV